jgi:hypothetical protein
MKNYRITYVNTEYSIKSISVIASSQEEARAHVYNNVEDCVQTLSAIIL